jgi:DNA-binding transcriptional ArsR family regulator
MLQSRSQLFRWRPKGCRLDSMRRRACEASEGSKRVITDESIAPVAALLADPTRMAILWALADGRPRPAGELARQARVSASTASEHLARLLAGGLVVVERHGRHRYYRVADARVIATIEAMGALARPVAPLGHGRTAAARAVRHARSCYDHLAGALSVQVARALIDRGTLVLRDEQYEVSAAGAVFLSNELGVDVERARASRRQFAKACLDWTEREYHVGGAVGSELLRQFLSLGWLERMEGSRGLCVTSSGRRGFRGLLGIDPLASRYAYDTAPT